MTINDDAWDTVTRELVIMSKLFQDPNIKQEFLDAATNVHTLFHVTRQFLDMGTELPLHKVICSCPDPTE